MSLTLKIIHWVNKYWFKAKLPSIITLAWKNCQIGKDYLEHFFPNNRMNGLCSYFETKQIKYGKNKKNYFHLIPMSHFIHTSVGKGPDNKGPLHRNPFSMSSLLTTWFTHLHQIFNSTFQCQSLFIRSAIVLWKEYFQHFERLRLGSNTNEKAFV